MGISFLFEIGEKDVFLQVLSREPVSSWVCTRMEIAFFILPFSLERKRKKQGEPTMVPPLTPFQRSTGTLSPSVDPTQGDRVCVSHQAVVRTAPRGRKAREGEKRRKLPGAVKTKIKKMGRKRERLQAAHRRAGVEMAVGKAPVSRQGFRLG